VSNELENIAATAGKKLQDMETKTLLGYIQDGYLVKVNGVYRITARGYRTASRYLLMWLRATSARSPYYNSPPHDVALLYLDGCTDSCSNGNVYDALYSHYKYRYWKRLRQYILDDVLNTDDRKLLGIES